LSIALKIQDQRSNCSIFYENVIQFPSKRITVRELIHARVAQEVESYYSGTTDKFLGLVQPTETETMLNGFKLSRGKKVNVEKQIQIAIEAFKSNGYFLFVNDKQVTEIDDEIILSTKTIVGFIKLIPLVGG
jgi:hypothetical protein